MVLPAYNEQDVLPETYRRFTAECPKWLGQFGLDYEIIFVNDGSRDRTADLLDGFAARPARPGGAPDAELRAPGGHLGRA